MTLGQKLRQLRQLEGDLRGLGRPLTQSELVRAIRSELGDTISQSYLSLIEKDARKHLSHHSRQLGAALDRLAAHAETRRCLVLLGEMISMPGLVDRLSETLVPEEQR
jgi:hypothetical protein